METLKHKGKKILIIDDEILITKVFSEHFQREGYEIEPADDGEEGFLKAKKFCPDLILLDIIMPKVDGISALKKLKKDSATKEIPVIVLTNLPDFSKNVDEALKLGSVGYLLKTDYNLKELTKRVDEALRC